MGGKTLANALVPFLPDGKLFSLIATCAPVVDVRSRRRKTALPVLWRGARQFSGEGGKSWIWLPPAMPARCSCGAWLMAGFKRAASRQAQ